MSAPREVMTRRAVDARVREGPHPDVQLRWCKEAEA
jgi:hypothetical protein